MYRQRTGHTTLATQLSCCGRKKKQNSSHQIYRHQIEVDRVGLSLYKIWCLMQERVDKKHMSITPATWHVGKHSSERHQRTRWLMENTVVCYSCAGIILRFPFPPIPMTSFTFPSILTIRLSSHSNFPPTTSFPFLFLLTTKPTNVAFLFTVTDNQNIKEMTISAWQKHII